MEADGQVEPSGNLNDDRANSGFAQPIAIVGMACRFPGAPDVPSFWQLLEAGGNAVSEGVPGSGDGAHRRAFSRCRCSERGLPVRRLPRQNRPVRRCVLSHFAGRGAIARPAAAVDAGNELEGDRGCGDGSGSAEGQPDRRLCGNQQSRLPQPDPGWDRDYRAGGQPLCRQRHFIQHSHRTGRLRTGTRGAGDGA